MAQGFRSKVKPSENKKSLAAPQKKAVTKGTRVYAPKKERTIADHKRHHNSKTATASTIEAIMVGRAEGSGNMRLVKPALPNVDAKKGSGSKSKK